MAEENYAAWSRLCELIWGCAIGQAIHVSVELGIPEILSAGSRSLAELAVATGADSWTLETVLRALVAFDVLKIEGEEKYTLAPMGIFLLKSAPGGSAREAGAFFDTLYHPLGALMTMVKTGGVAFEHVYGKSFYDHLTEHPELATPFYDLMEVNASRRYAELSAVCDLSVVSRVVDVGGGEGSLLVQILRENSNLRGVLFDLPIVSSRAHARISTAALANRCEIISGDFRQSVPRGGDVYILAQILNNWRDEDASLVLANCRAAMEAHARLLVLEPIFVPGPLARWRTLVSLGVMAQRGGRTRSEAQMRFLLATAGFEIEDIRRLPSSETHAIRAKPI